MAGLFSHVFDQISFGHHDGGYHHQCGVDHNHSIDHPVAHIIDNRAQLQWNNTLLHPVHTSTKSGHQLGTSFFATTNDAELQPQDSYSAIKTTIPKGHKTNFGVIGNMVNKAWHNNATPDVDVGVEKPASGGGGVKKDIGAAGKHAGLKVDKDDSVKDEKNLVDDNKRDGVVVGKKDVASIRAQQPAPPDYILNSMEMKNQSVYHTNKLDLTRPIIFEDVDGVLNSHDPESGMLDRNLIDKLDKLVGETNAQIILSSHWRKNTRLVNMLLGEFKNTQNHLDDRIIGATPSLCYGVECRAHEITEWLKAHKEFKGNYIALDDWNLYEQPDGEKFIDHFVNTDPSLGITNEDVDEATLLLKKPLMTEEDHPSFPLGLGDTIPNNTSSANSIAIDTDGNTAVNTAMVANTAANTEALATNTAAANTAAEVGLSSNAAVGAAAAGVAMNAGVDGGMQMAGGADAALSAGADGGMGSGVEGPSQAELDKLSQVDSVQPNYPPDTPLGEDPEDDEIIGDVLGPDGLQGGQGQPTDNGSTAAATQQAGEDASTQPPATADVQLAQQPTNDTDVDARSVAIIAPAADEAGAQGAAADASVQAAAGNDAASNAATNAAGSNVATEATKDGSSFLQTSFMQASTENEIRYELEDESSDVGTLQLQDKEATSMDEKQSTMDAEKQPNFYGEKHDQNREGHGHGHREGHDRDAYDYDDNMPATPDTTDHVSDGHQDYGALSNFDNNSVDDVSDPSMADQVPQEDVEYLENLAVKGGRMLDVEERVSVEPTVSPLNNIPNIAIRHGTMNDLKPNSMLMNHQFDLNALRKDPVGGQNFERFSNDEDEALHLEKKLKDALKAEGLELPPQPSQEEIHRSLYGKKHGFVSLSEDIVKDKDLMAHTKEVGLSDYTKDLLDRMNGIRSGSTMPEQTADHIVGLDALQKGGGKNLDLPDDIKAMLRTDETKIDMDLENPVKAPTKTIADRIGKPPVDPPDQLKQSLDHLKQSLDSLKIGEHIQNLDEEGYGEIDEGNADDFKEMREELGGLKKDFNSLKKSFADYADEQNDKESTGLHPSTEEFDINGDADAKASRNLFDGTKATWLTPNTENLNLDEGSSSKGAVAAQTEETQTEDRDDFDFVETIFDKDGKPIDSFVEVGKYDGVREW